MLPARLLVVASLCAARLAHADDPPPLASWNQWEDSGASGVARGVLLLGTDVAFRLPSLPGTSPRTLFVGIQLEGGYMVTDGFGLRTEVTFQVHDGATSDVRLIPATIGGVLHALPKSPIDLYLGARGGLALVHIGDGGDELEPTVGVLGGIAFHYWGMFLVSAEVGYDVLRYGTQSLDGPCFAIGTGLAL